MADDRKDGPRRALPRDYAGLRHQTLGSDILAVAEILRAPELTFDAATASRLRVVRSNDWYPIEWLLDLMDRVDEKLGEQALLQMGRKLFRLSHAARVGPGASSARDIAYGIDGMYRHANRGTKIGGWKVLAFEPGLARLEKSTPHRCVMEEGLLLEALSTVGAPSRIVQTECVRRGAPACIFEITSTFTDARWTG